jgi:hypothetical protein
VTVGALDAVARQRAVLTTTADLIAAASAGRCLRVAVNSPDPGFTTFADQLVQALHARGRPCSLLSTLAPTRSGDATLATRLVHTQTIAMITSDAPGQDDAEPIRIDILLDTPSPIPTPQPGHARHHEPRPDATSDTATTDQPHIVID